MEGHCDGEKEAKVDGTADDDGFEVTSLGKVGMPNLVLFLSPYYSCSWNYPYCSNCSCSYYPQSCYWNFHRNCQKNCSNCLNYSN